MKKVGVADTSACQPSARSRAASADGWWKIFTIWKRRPSLSCRSSTTPGPLAWAGAWLSTKKTLPEGPRHDLTIRQKGSSFSGGTCDSQNPKKTKSNARGGDHRKRSACTYSTLAAPPRRGRVGGRDPRAGG